MKKSTIEIAVKVSLIVCSVLFVSSCGIGMERSSSKDVPANAPLSEFVIGRWEYEGAYNYNGYEYTDIYRTYTFLDEGTVTVCAEDDCGTCSYEFIEAEVVSIDCSPRNRELIILSIKRDGQYLLVEQAGSEQLKFERIERR